MYPIIRSFLIRTTTCVCIFTLLGSSAPFAYGWAAGNPEAGPDADNGSTGTAQGGSGPAGGSYGGNSSGNTGFEGSPEANPGSIGGGSAGSGNTGSGEGSGGDAGGGWGQGAGAGDGNDNGGFGVGQTGFEGSPEAQRSSVTESFDSWAFSGNETNVSIETSQSALDAVSSALSALGEAFANEFGMAAQAAPQQETTAQVTVGRSAHVTNDPEAFAQYESQVAGMREAYAVASENFSNAIAANDDAAADQAYDQMSTLNSQMQSVAESIFGVSASTVAYSAESAEEGEYTSIGTGESSNRGSGSGSGTGQAGAGNIGSLAGHFSSMGVEGNSGNGSGQAGAGNIGGLAGNFSSVSGSGNSNSSGNEVSSGGSAGTTNNSGRTENYSFGSSGSGNTNTFTGSVNPGNGTVELQNVINLSAETGSLGIAEYNGQEVTVSGPTPAITGLSGAIEYTERDRNTLGLTFAGELPGSIVGKIQRGESLTNDEVRQVAVVANIAVTRALAEARVVHGPFNGSLADALEAPSQFSALNADKIGSTRSAYNQNPNAFNEMARQFLDGTVARERGYGVAVPVPRANVYWNPDAVDNPRTAQVEREPAGWGAAVTDRTIFGARPHSHVAGTLVGEYQTRGQLEGLDTLNIDVFRTVMGIDDRGLAPTNQEALDDAGARFAFNTGGELSGLGMHNSQTGATSFVPVDPNTFSEAFANENQLSVNSLGGVSFDRSSPSLPENAFTAPAGIFDLTSQSDYVDVTGARVTAGSFQLGATGLAEAQQHAQLTETYENATHRTEAPDTTINGLSLGQVAQVEVANFNQRNGTNYGVNVYSAKGPHGSARHRDHDDTARGINGCACAIDFSITDENGRALSVDGNEDVYAEVARGLVGRTGGAIGLGAEYMSHGMHFDVAHVINPDTSAFADAGLQEWGSLGNAMENEFASLRESAPEATVQRNDDTNQVSVTLPTEETAFNPDTIPGITNDIYGINPNESRFVDSEELDSYVEEQQRAAEVGAEETASDPEDDSITERVTQQVRDFIQFITNLLDGSRNTSPTPNGDNNATTTSPISLHKPSGWIAFLLLIPTAHAQTDDATDSSTLTNYVVAVWKWLFGSEEAPRRTFSDLPGAQLHAFSRPYVPILIQVDEVTGAVKFTRGEIKNVTEASELPEALEIAFESENDSSSLVLNEFGDIIYSNGIFAPETDAEGKPLPIEMDYVYFVEYWRDGDLVRSETNTGALPGNFFTRALSDLFSSDDSFLLPDVATITYVQGDPNPNATDDDYREYTITLTDGTVRHIALPVNSALSYFKKELEDIGYNGDILALLNIATETGRKEGAAAKGFIARTLDKFTGSTDAQLPDQRQEVFSDLTAALTSNEYGFTASGVNEVLVHFNVPVTCEDAAATGYIYEVTLTGYRPDGALTDLSAAAARCGSGGPRTFATEIAAHITAATGLAVSDEQVLELIKFQYNTPEYVYLNEEGDATTSTPAIPNTTNEVVLEAKVTRGGTTITDWSSSAISLMTGDQLHLRWNAAAYQRCLPFIADNGAYSLSQSDLRLTTGNTEAEGYDLTERTGTYRIECDGQLNGEDGVDERRIEVQVN